MVMFRTTHNILKAPSEGDYFDENWMNFDTIQLPQKQIGIMQEKCK